MYLCLVVMYGLISVFLYFCWSCSCSLLMFLLLVVVLVSCWWYMKFIVLEVFIIVICVVGYVRLMLQFMFLEFIMQYVLLQVLWVMIVIFGMVVLLQVQSSLVLCWMMLLYFWLVFGRKFGMFISMMMGILKQLQVCINWVVFFEVLIFRQLVKCVGWLVIMLIGWLLMCLNFIMMFWV